ncbi:hypothetical protein As57867_006975, partial [Aphanomyces stellatus]
DACATSARTNASLRTLCQQHAALAETMKRWVVQACHVPISLGESPARHKVTLAAHPAARRLGFDWITQQMYYNRDRVLALFHDTIDDTNPDCLQYVWRWQREIDAPLEVVRDKFARANVDGQMRGSNIWPTTPVPAAAAVEALDDEALSSLNARYVHTLWNPHRAPVHFLSREFNTPDQSVFVAQCIHDDECFPSTRAIRDRSLWYLVHTSSTCVWYMVGDRQTLSRLVLDRVGPSTTMLRAVTLNSHAFTKHCYVPLEQEMQGWGCDVGHVATDQGKMVLFGAHVRRIVNQHNAMFEREVRAKLAFDDEWLPCQQ